MTDKKLKFRVRPGFRHNQGTDLEVGAGEIVELTAEEAKGFLDKLEPVAFDDSKEISNAAERAKLESMKLPRLRALPEWKKIEPPKPTSRKDTVDAILKVREEAKKE